MQKKKKKSAKEKRQWEGKGENKCKNREDKAKYVLWESKNNMS